MEKYLLNLKTVPPEYIKDFVNQHIVYLVACSIGFLLCLIFASLCVKRELTNNDLNDPAYIFGAAFGFVVALVLVFVISYHIVAIVSPLLIIDK